MVEWLSIKSERRESAGERLKLGSILVVEWLSSEFNQLRETRVGRGCG